MIIRRCNDRIVLGGVLLLWITSQVSRQLNTAKVVMPLLHRTRRRVRFLLYAFKIFLLLKGKYKHGCMPAMYSMLQLHVVNLNQNVLKMENK